MSQPKTSKKKPTPAPEEGTPTLVATVGRETLEATVTKSLSFVRAIGTSQAIRAAMAEYGYEDADQKEGWDLIHAASGFGESERPAPEDSAVRRAITTLDVLDEDLFRVTQASLRRRHPAVANFVLQGLGPSTGPAAVVGVKKLLERFDALENSPERKATRAEDHAALATLAKRKLDAKRRAELAALVATAESMSAAPKADEGAAREAAEKDYEQRLIALRAWYEEWSEVARTAVKRRDYLIRMGLAKRKGAEKKGKNGEVDGEAKPG